MFNKVSLKTLAGASCWLAVTLFLIGCDAANRQSVTWIEPTERSINRPEEIVWKPGLPSMPPGMQVAHLEGDSTKPGPYVMRVRIPAGTQIMPHTHPGTERVTVLSGAIHWKSGEVFDPADGLVLPPGTYAYWPAGMKHFVWTTSDTEIQLHGIGPWGINYLNPADDPRQKSK